MKKFRRCEPEEADIVLFNRDKLAEALRRNPNGLTKDERKKLRELDATLKANAELMAKSLPELPQIRRRLKPPRSHWWWFLDKLVEKRKSVSETKSTREGDSSGEHRTAAPKAKRQKVGAK
jgi:hypothetical protein